MSYKPIKFYHVVDGLFTKRSEFFPVPTVHEEWVRNRIPRGAHYDPADDGPEVDVARIIIYNHPWVLSKYGREKALYSPNLLWLCVGPAWPAVAVCDILVHGRE